MPTTAPPPVQKTCTGNDKRRPTPSATPIMNLAALSPKTPASVVSDGIGVIGGRGDGSALCS